LSFCSPGKLPFTYGSVLFSLFFPLILPYKYSSQRSPTHHHEKLKSSFFVRPTFSIPNQRTRPGNLRHKEKHFQSHKVTNTIANFGKVKKVAVGVGNSK